MDLKRLTLTGPPVPVLDDVQVQANSAEAAFDFSPTGILAYMPKVSLPRRSLAWVDASGKLQGMSAPLKPYTSRITLSPDGARLVAPVEDGPMRTLWLIDCAHDRFFPLTPEKGIADYPSWAPDGNHVTYVWPFFRGSSEPGIYWMRADGAGSPQRLVDLSKPKFQDHLNASI